MFLVYLKSFSKKKKKKESLKETNMVDIKAYFWYNLNFCDNTVGHHLSELVGTGGCSDN